MRPDSLLSLWRYIHPLLTYCWDVRIICQSRDVQWFSASVGGRTDGYSALHTEILPKMGGRKRKERKGGWEKGGEKRKEGDEGERIKTSICSLSKTLWNTPLCAHANVLSGVKSCLPTDSRGGGVQQRNKIDKFVLCVCIA